MMNYYNTSGSFACQGASYIPQYNSYADNRTSYSSQIHPHSSHHNSVYYANTFQQSFKTSPHAGLPNYGYPNNYYNNYRNQANYYNYNSNNIYNNKYNGYSYNSYEYNNLFNNNYNNSIYSNYYNNSNNYYNTVKDLSYTPQQLCQIQTASNFPYITVVPSESYINISPRGIDIILIAVLILTALDLIIIRPIRKIR